MKEVINETRSDSESPSVSNSELKLITFKEVCSSLGIKSSTGYDWRNPESPRYKPDFPTPYYLSSRSVRFSKQAVLEWALKCNGGQDHV